MVAVGAAALGKAVEQLDELLKEQLELPRHKGEARDDEDPAHQREDDQDRGDDVGRDEPRIHLDEPEQAHFQMLVQHRVAHHILNGLALASARTQQRSDEQRQHNEREHEQLPRPLLFFHACFPPFPLLSARGKCGAEPFFTAFTYTT